MKKKVLCLLISIAVLCAFMPSMALVANAKTASGYSVTKALSYAKAHWNTNKSDDCVTFVKKCLEYGGIPRDKSRTYGYSCKQYVDYLVKNGYAKMYKLETQVLPYTSDIYVARLSSNLGKVSKGDMLLYYCNNSKCPKPYYHVSICNGATGDYQGQYYGFLTCYAHNVAQNNRLVCKIKCSKCGASKKSTTIYSLHMTSKANGYITYTGKVSGLKTTSLGYNKLQVSWTKLSSATGYKVYRATSKTGKYYLVKTTTQRYFNDTNVATNKTYCYKVKPYKTVSYNNNYGYYSSVISGKAVVTAPKDLTAASEEAGVASLSWSKVTGATGYKVYRALSTSGTYYLVKTIAYRSDASWKDENRQSGKEYYYKVRAIRKTPVATYQSTYSQDAKVLIR